MTTYRLEKRIEKDSLGSMEVPSAVYYGVQTARAIQNFPISGLRAHPKFIDAYMLLKKAAALINMKSGLLSERQGNAIMEAADDVLSGNLRDQFVVDVFQMGAGTSFNMNCNEVLANRAIELLGGKMGAYDLVHPNDHVNMSQSTNDTYPTAMRLSALLLLPDLEKEIEALSLSLGEKGKEFDTVLKSARTHLQDAVPIRLGDEFAAYSLAIGRCLVSIRTAKESLRELGIGGSAAGTGLNTPVHYSKLIVAALNEMLDGMELREAQDMREAMQSQRLMAELSSSFRNLALELGRICNDLRLLSSGPMTGFDEIRLPPVAPGSSMMPGKINPSMLEMVNMVCYQIIGSDTTISYAVQAGQLELNVMMPVIAYNILFSIEIMTSALHELRTRCIEGLAANRERCRYLLEKSLGLATALNTIIGYSKAAEVAAEASKSGRSIIEIIREKRILSDEEVRRVLDPAALTRPGIPRRNLSQEG